MQTGHAFIAHMLSQEALADKNSCMVQHACVILPVHACIIHFALVVTTWIDILCVIHFTYKEGGGDLMHQV